MKLEQYRIDAEAGLIYGATGRVLTSKPNRYTTVTLERIRDKPRCHRKAWAHRVIWESVNGPIPDGMQINHKNGIKNDNRIENLELVTGSENVRHAVRTGLLRNARGESAGKSRLTEADVLSIRREYVRGNGRFTPGNSKSLAEKYGVSACQIREVASRRSWRHVTNEECTND